MEYEYSSIEPCPPERMKRSLSTHCGSAGLCLIWLAHNSYAAEAHPKGSPGCPDFAFWIASADNTRMALAGLCFYHAHFYNSPFVVAT